MNVRKDVYVSVTDVYEVDEYDCEFDVDPEDVNLEDRFFDTLRNTKMSEITPIYRVVLEVGEDGWERVFETRDENEAIMMGGWTEGNPEPEE